MEMTTQNALSSLLQHIAWAWCKWFKGKFAFSHFRMWILNIVYVIDSITQSTHIYTMASIQFHYVKRAKENLRKRTEWIGKMFHNHNRNRWYFVRNVNSTITHTNSVQFQMFAYIAFVCVSVCVCVWRKIYTIQYNHWFSIENVRFLFSARCKKGMKKQKTKQNNKIFFFIEEHGEAHRRNELCAYSNIL